MSSTWAPKVSACGRSALRYGALLLVRTNAKAAGIDLRVTPHTLRHGCATHLLQGGADVRHVQKLLGHSNVQTTAIYTHVDTKDLARVVAKAHPRERSWKRRKKSPGK